MIAALAFAWVGDIFLMVQNESNQAFIFGIGAFLLNHVTYIFAYREARNEIADETNQSFIHTRIAFLLFVGGALLYMLYPVLDDLLLPVTLYAVGITTMGIFALKRRGRTVEKSFLMVYSGALLFIMSDSIIAINTFLSPVIQAGFLVMATYITAQFLIVKGILIHENQDHESVTNNIS